MVRGRYHPGRLSARFPGTFLLALREGMNELQWEIVKWLGEGILCKDSTGRQHFLGLEPLYRRLLREKRDDWPRRITEILKQVPHEIPDSKATLSSLADRVLCRVGPVFGEGENEDKIWFREYVEKQISLTLVVDYPNTMSYINQARLEESGQPAEFWLDRAMENLKARTPREGIKPIHPQLNIYRCQIGDAYDTSRVVLLDWLFPEHQEHGFYVALPGRDLFYFLPADDQGKSQLHFLTALSDQTHHLIPYPITDQIYWVRQGIWQTIPDCVPPVAEVETSAEA